MAGSILDYPTVCIGLYTFFTIMLMDWVNTYAYERVPEALPPLPDLGFDMIPKTSGPIYPADIVTCSLFAISAIQGLREGWKHIPKVRQLLVVYAVILNLRTLTIIVTTLPICYEHGPCREQHLPLQSRLITMLAYAFALGFPVPGVVQCGDYIFSGHTVFIWLMTLHVIKILKPDHTIKTLFYIWAFLGSCAIVSFRKHYTIDVVIAIIVTCLVWHVHHLKFTVAMMKGKAVNSWTDALVLWVGGCCSDGMLSCDGGMQTLTEYSKIEPVDDEESMMDHNNVSNNNNNNNGSILNSNVSNVSTGSNNGAISINNNNNTAGPSNNNAPPIAAALGRVAASRNKDRAE